MTTVRERLKNTECSGEQNSNHGLDQWTSEYSESMSTSKAFQTQLGAKHIKRELTRELTETRDFFYIKNTWHFIVESYIESLGKSICILKLFPSVAIFWTSVPAVTTSLYRSAEPERQSFSFGTDVVH